MSSQPEEHRGRKGRRNRNDQPGVEAPTLSRPARRRRNRKRRGAAIPGTRRRRASRERVEDLLNWFQAAPPEYVATLYRALGGQPDQQPDHERVVQLTVRALTQGKNRLGAVVRSLHERERTALAILIQAGGIAQDEEFHHELSLTLGGHEREWRRVMLALGEKGLVAATEEREGRFFYLVPEPLVPGLTAELEDQLRLPTFEQDDIRVRDARPFSPPLGFSIATLITYLDQHPVRLTQQQEIYKHHKEELDAFFAQVWDPDSELFHFHMDFLISHGLAELQGDHLGINHHVVQEWIQLDPEDQRDLALRSLDRRFRYAEWVLWAIHAAGGKWVPERPLSALYRRWVRGEEWRERYHAGQFAAPRTHDRQSWSFAPLVHCGMLELGEWGQEKFYRLTPRAKALLEPPADDEFTSFYLTPSFEIMAPAGLDPALLLQIGELAELTGCDRANTYRITEISVERALERGWTRDDVLDFLRANSQTGLPANVEQTLRSWIGHHGDVAFHRATLMTVHRSRIRKVESMRQLKPFLLHRFAPGLYAVDPEALPRIREILRDAGMEPIEEVATYPGEPAQMQARERLLQLVAEARAEVDDPTARAQAADTAPEDIRLVPGVSVQRGGRRKRRDLPPRVSPREARMIADRAIKEGRPLEVLYLSRDGRRVRFRVRPERLAVTPAGDEVMVGTDLSSQDRRSYRLTHIERLRAVEA